MEYVLSVDENTLGLLAWIHPLSHQRIRGKGRAVRLLYNVTSAVQLEISERYLYSVFGLYFAAELNPTFNPPSSNPFTLLCDFQEIFEKNDRKNPKVTKHIAGIKFYLEKTLGDRALLDEAIKAIDAMGMHGIRPVLTILEADTYIARGNEITQVPPDEAGSPTSVEYFVLGIHGPKHSDPELHIHPLFGR